MAIIIYLDEEACYSNYELLKAAVGQHAVMSNPDLVTSHSKLHEVVEDLHFDIPTFKEDPHPYGWYRKFEKKRF